MNTVALTTRDLWCLLRERRVKEALADIREIVGERFYMNTEQVVVRKELAPAEPSAARAIKVRQSEPRDLPQLADFNRRQCNTRRTHRFTTGLAEGKRALLGFCDGELIGYFWWHDAAHAADGYYLTRFGLDLAEDEVYGYDLFIAPEHRGHPTPAEFLAGVEAELARLGYRRMYGFVDSANMPARWLYASSGYEDVLRSNTRTVLKRLLRIEGRGWLVAGSDGLRPLSEIGPLGRRHTC